MADTDLVFGFPASEATTDLVFGADEDLPIVDAPITVAVSLPPVVSVHPYVPQPVAVSVSFGITVSVRPVYVSGASRPTVGQVSAQWQQGVPAQITIKHRHTAALPAAARAGNRYQQADKLQHTNGVKEEIALPMQSGYAVRHQDAIPLRSRARAAHQDATRLRNTVGGRHQQGISMSAAIGARHQDALRDRRNRTAGRWQNGVPKSSSYTGSMRTAQHLDKSLGGRYQEGMKPPPGIWDRTPVIPPEHVCYTPDPDLVFKKLWDGSPHLVFICDDHDEPEPPATVVVPIKRVYVVLNESSLRRVDGNIPLPTFSMSMSLDVDSWTWSFSASLPGRALADLEPSSPGEPVLVEAMINGVAYRMQVERRSRDRSFNQSAIKISGRGLAAVLDAPVAPVMNFTNAEARTAQQLMNDVLTLGGVSIGWEVDWRAIDWSVPAGLFSHQGVYISALNQIAEAAGSYIQPHPTLQNLIVLPRYPDLPWDWDEVTPDYEIPSAVATIEGIEWINKPAYNRVYVSGVQGGILGQVTRAGTDGSALAPMVTNPLITTEAAARQRATPVLADTGSQAMVSLRLPVLEATGIIQPGKYVRYVDGATTRVGLTRSVSVDDGRPEIWQTIQVETHV